jgi:myotubularin-related protein 1/2
MASSNNGFQSVSKTNLTEAADPLSMFASESTTRQDDSSKGGPDINALGGNTFMKADAWVGFIKKNVSEAAKSVKAVAKDASDTVSLAVNEYNKGQKNSSDGGSSFDPVVPVATSLEKEDLRLPNLDKKTVRIDESVPTRTTSSSMRSASTDSVTREREYSNALDHLPLLTGEKPTMVHLDAYVQYGPGKMIPGALHMTNYRIRFVPNSGNLHAMASTNPSVYSWLNIPLACIDRIDKERKPKDSKQTGVTVLFTCKDVRQHRITIHPENNDDYEVDRAIATMAAYAFPNDMKYLFAFAHIGNNREKHSLLYNPEDICDIMLEFSRQGVLDLDKQGTCRWRLTDANANYRLCNSYPKLMIVPMQFTDEDIFVVAGFRSGQRIPVLSWGCRDTGATLWRSAQPKAGVSGSNAHDEMYLDIIANSQNPAGHAAVIDRMRSRAQTVAQEKNRKPSETFLHIVDCRPMASAMANRAAGAGYESHANYPNCRLEFYNIPNIHVMRDAYRQMMSIMQNFHTSDINFTKVIEDTQWLHYTRLILKASHETATMLQRGVPVLVHCSHGWDRTPQVTALAQLFLDPYYRTFDGFKVVVEKEWCSFGHQFQMRCAHSQDRTTRQEDQFSPVFLQFLDCVWQVVKQNPQYFEFNSRYVLALADSIYSGRFGTFLFSTDQERDAVDAHKRTVSIWTYLRRNRHIFMNPLYVTYDENGRSGSKVLLPPLSQLMRNVRLWDDYFLRWSNVPSMLNAPVPLSKYLYDPHGNAQPSLTEEEAKRLKYKCFKEDAENNTSRESYSDTAAYNAHDWDVPAIATNDDFWEAAYRMERQEKDMLLLNSEINSGQGSVQPTPTVESLVAAQPVTQPLSGTRKTLKGYSDSADDLSELLEEELTVASSESAYVSPSKRTSRKSNLIENRIIMGLTKMLRDKGASPEEIAAVIEAAEAPTTGSITNSLFNMTALDGSNPARDTPPGDASAASKLTPAAAKLAADLIVSNTSSPHGIFDDSNLESVPGRPSEINMQYPDQSSITPSVSSGNMSAMVTPVGDAQDVDDDNADEDSVFSTDDQYDDTSTRAFRRSRRAPGTRSNNHRVRNAQYMMAAVPATNTHNVFDDMSHNSSTTDATEMADSQLSDSSDSMAVLR